MRVSNLSTINQYLIRIASTALVLILISLNIVHAQDGDIDVSFAANEYLSLSGSNVTKIALGADGRIVFAGDFQDINDHRTENVAILKNDATIDTSFSTSVLPQNSITALAFQADGKVLIGGRFTSINGVAASSFARLNADGSLDTSFQAIVDGGVNSVDVQNDNKILIAGFFSNVNEVSIQDVARLMPDGSLDTNFNPDRTYNNPKSVRSIRSNKVLLAGAFGVTRLTENGTTDSEFTLPQVSNVEDAVEQEDLKLIIGGSFTSITTDGSATTRNRLARLDADGSLDANYDPDLDNSIESLELFNDGRLAVGGRFDNVGGLASRSFAIIDAMGVSAARQNTIFVDSAAEDMIIDANQQIIIVNSASSRSTENGISRFNVIRYTSEDLVDPALEVQALTDTNVNLNVISQDSEGRTLVAGSFTKVNGVTIPNLVRLTPTGEVDTSFVTPIEDGNRQNSATIAVQADNKVLVSGFLALGGNDRAAVFMRLNEDGSTDAGFNRPSSLSLPDVLAIGSDQKIIAAQQRDLFRLNEDGSRDDTFSKPNLNSSVRTVTLDEDGGIYIAGPFSEVNGEPRDGLAKLDSDGTLNPVFSSTLIEGFSFNFPIALMDDAKIVVGGGFTEIDGVERNGLARFNADGSLDLSFNPNIGSTVNALIVQPDGKIILGGSFSRVGGELLDTVDRNLARINADGSLDTDFIAGTNSVVQTLHLQEDGKLLVAGSFLQVNGEDRQLLVRLETGIENEQEQEQQICIPIVAENGNVAVVCL